MLPGFGTQDDPEPALRKSSIIDRELLRLRVGVAALQETRLSDEGSLREDNYTFFWKGRESGERRDYGVGFAVRNDILNCIEPPKGISERIMCLRINTHSGPVLLISAYAPTLQASPEDKDAFYEDLCHCLTTSNRSDKLLLLGDFNARIGNNQNNWPDCVGLHGIGNMNENGQRLLEFCASHSLCITNTYFHTKAAHKVSWRHPRSGHWHQLDFIITRRRDLRDILNARTYHSGDCDTDHSLVMAKTRLIAKKIHSANNVSRRIKINTKSAIDERLYNRFNREIENKLSPETLENLPNSESMWSIARDTITQIALETFGTQGKTQKDWFAEYEDELLPYLESKRNAYISYLNNMDNERLKLRYQTAKADLQRVSRHFANRYWVSLSETIQHCHKIGDFRGMYQGIKTAIGPVARKRAEIKDRQGNPISDKQQQLRRWQEHYSNLYSDEININPTALDSLPVFPSMSDLDDPPTLEEFQQAIKSLKLGKSSGRDNLPAEIISYKCVVPILYQVLLKCWEEGTVLQDMRDADIITLYKGKGDRGDCNNYRGISLLSVTGKAFAKVILKKIETLAARIYPESQCGFRPGRSTNDMIFTLRQLQEKSREHQTPLYIAFVDLNKAFDSAFHDNMQGSVIFDGLTTEAFSMNRGIRQGCVLAPTLFGIFFSAILIEAFKQCDIGIHLHTRKDGRLFNIQHLKSKNKRYDILVRELLYADDAALVAKSEQELQELVNRFDHACRLYSMSINTKKTVIMAQGVDHPPHITLDGTPLEIVDHFCYLGSTTTSNLCNNKEIDTRIGRAACNFGKLSTRVWRNNKLTITTKILVYKTCVLNTLLYGSETWTTYSKQERRLNAFHMRCLRAILGVTWKDRVTNEAVLSKTNCNSILATLKQRRLRWLGHVHRMDTERLPREVMLGQIADAKRRVGRPNLRFKDCCKRDMDSFNINANSWETRANERLLWRRDLRAGTAIYDEAWLDNIKQKRLRIKNAAPVVDPRFTCDKCGKKCRAAIGLFSHKRKCLRH
nr:transposon TX1 uncharacterized 149 kDa protein [Helicoverpa armigera]